MSAYSFYVALTKNLIDLVENYDRAVEALDKSRQFSITAMRMKVLISFYIETGLKLEQFRTAHGRAHGKRNASLCYYINPGYNETSKLVEIFDDLGIGYSPAFDSLWINSPDKMSTLFSKHPELQDRFKPASIYVSPLGFMAEPLTLSEETV